MKARHAKKLLQTASIQVVHRIRPGDVLLVRLPLDRMPREALDRAATRLRELFPDNKVLVAPLDTSIEVIRKEHLT